MMKNILLICLLVLPSCWLKGQSTTEKPLISLAYFSQFGFQPGIKMATEFSLKKLTTQTQKTKKRNLFINPQIGFFTWPNNHSSLLLNADIGIKRQKEAKSAFSALSIGLGYLHEFQIATLAVQLGDGSQSTTRTSRSYFLPTVNYAFGSRLSSAIGWYSKIGVGQRFGGNVTASTTVLFELGLQFRL